MEGKIRGVERLISGGASVKLSPTYGTGKVTLTVVQTGTDASKPAAGNTEGDIFWATDTNKMYVWDGAAWTQIGGGHTIQDEGTSLTQRGKLNFTGAGVTATDDAGNDQTDVDIPGGSGSVGMGPTGLISTRIKRSAAKSINNDTDTVVDFDQEDYDTETLHDTAVNNSRITFSRTGKWIVWANMDFAADIDGYRRVYAQLNGATNLQVTTLPSAGSVATAIPYYLEREFTAGDYIEFHVRHTAGAALNVTPVAGATLLIGPGLSVVSKSAAYTLVNGDDVVLADATGGAFSLTLPTAVGITGKVFYMKKIDASANAVTVDANGAQTIDGALTYSLATQYKAVTILSDGANWHIISAF